jgi:hypothetical protein
MPFQMFLVPVFHGDEKTRELKAFIASHRVAPVGCETIGEGTQPAFAAGVGEAPSRLLGFTPLEETQGGA